MSGKPPRPPPGRLTILQVGRTAPCLSSKQSSDSTRRPKRKREATSPPSDHEPLTRPEKAAHDTPVTPDSVSFPSSEPSTSLASTDDRAHTHTLAFPSSHEDPSFLDETSSISPRCRKLILLVRLYEIRRLAVCSTTRLLEAAKKENEQRAEYPQLELERNILVHEWKAMKLPHEDQEGFTDTFIRGVVDAEIGLEKVNWLEGELRRSTEALGRFEREIEREAKRAAEKGKQNFESTEYLTMKLLSGRGSLPDPPDESWMKMLLHSSSLVCSSALPEDIKPCIREYTERLQDVASQLLVARRTHKFLHQTLLKAKNHAKVNFYPPQTQTLVRLIEVECMKAEQQVVELQGEVKLAMGRLESLVQRYPDYCNMEFEEAVESTGTMLEERDGLTKDAEGSRGGEESEKKTTVLEVRGSRVDGGARRPTSTGEAEEGGLRKKRKTATLEVRPPLNLPPKRSTRYNGGFMNMADVES